MDEDRGPDVVALVVVLTALSTIIVVLRLSSKLFILRNMGWDDGMMVVAVVRSENRLLDAFSKRFNFEA